MYLFGHGFTNDTVLEQDTQTVIEVLKYMDGINEFSFRHTNPLGKYNGMVWYGMVWYG